jgi:hypothetical protein
VIVLTIAPGEVYPPVEAFRLQARLIPVGAGLHLIRYEAAKNTEHPPVVLIQAMPDDCAHVTLRSAKGGNGVSLDGPGDVIEIRALRDVRLVATTASLHPCADAAVLTLERIGGRQPSATRSTATVELIQPPQSAGFPGEPALSKETIFHDRQ